jgi:Uma2 family endonuclease
VDKPYVSVEDFERMIAQPDNADQLYELVRGEVIELSPGRTRYSEIGHLIAVAVHLHCREKGLRCHTSGGDGAYRIQGQVVAPDFAYKLTPMSDDYPDPEPPLWVAEIISPMARATAIREKRQIYREAGILLWELYPQSRSADVYGPKESMHGVGLDGMLDCSAIVPGFRLAVRDLFRE